MRTIPRTALLTAAVALLLSGCVYSGPLDPPAAPLTAASPSAASPPSAAPPSAAPDWSTASYRFTLDSRCGERALIGVYHVTVEHGVVTSADPQESTGWTPDREELEWFPTVAQLLARSQAHGDAAPSEFHLDPSTGVPTVIAFEGRPDVIDDEECYRISDYVTTVGTAE